LIHFILKTPLVLFRRNPNKILTLIVYPFFCLTAVSRLRTSLNNTKDLLPCSLICWYFKFTKTT
jgi:hypothetical protein